MIKMTLSLFLAGGIFLSCGIPDPSFEEEELSRLEIQAEIENPLEAEHKMLDSLTNEGLSLEEINEIIEKEVYYREILASGDTGIVIDFVKRDSINALLSSSKEISSSSIEASSSTEISSSSSLQEVSSSTAIPTLLVPDNGSLWEEIETGTFNVVLSELCTNGSMILQAYDSQIKATVLGGERMDWVLIFNDLPKDFEMTFEGRAKVNCY